MLFESEIYRRTRFDTHATKASILAQAQIHTTYTYKHLDFTFKCLPQYDSLITCAEMNDKEEVSHIETEIDRLVNHIQQHDLRDSLLNLGDQIGYAVTEAALEDIAIVVDRINTNLDLCVFDMSIMIVKELAPHRNAGKQTEELVQSALKKAESCSHVLLREYVGSPKIVPRPPREPQIVRDQSKLYLTLLEYFTSLLSRFLMNSAKGDIWVHKCLGVLARMTAKLRLLGYEAAIHAERSIYQAQEIVTELQIAQEEKWTTGGSPEGLRFWEQGSPNPHQRFTNLVDITNPLIVYHSEQYRIRTQLASILSTLLDGFSQRSRVSGCKPYSFELNTIIRAAKSPSEDEGIPLWLISEDRHSGINILDESRMLRVNYTGCQLLLYNLLASRERTAGQPPPSLSNSSEESASTSATIDWSFNCLKDSEMNFLDGVKDVMSSPERAFLQQDIRSPEDYVSILAPLLLSSSSIAKHTMQLIAIVQSYRGSGTGVTLHEQRHYEAMFTFRCSVGQVDEDPLPENITSLSSFRKVGWRSSFSKMNDSGSTSNVKTRSKLHYKRLLRPMLSSSDLEMANSAPSPPLEDFLGIKEMDEMYSRHQKIMKSWKVSDKAVIVQCNKFVLSAVGIFLAIIIVGLAILFKFGKKMTGIDRLNILIFLWTVSVVGVTLSKSWYTKDWSWHDFVHRQLPCKSVRELSKVTGVDKQVIMMYLLRNNHERLYAVGEYNSLFRQTAHESFGGFSIDCPQKLSTLLACGFLVLMVVSEDGVHLICIGGKKRNQSVNCGSKTRVLVCKAPKLTGGDGEKVELHFKEENFSWERSYGLYTNPNILFG